MLRKNELPGQPSNPNVEISPVPPDEHLVLPQGSKPDRIVGTEKVVAPERIEAVGPVGNPYVRYGNYRNPSIQLPIQTSSCPFCQQCEEKRQRIQDFNTTTQTQIMGSIGVLNKNVERIEKALVALSMQLPPSK